MTTFKIFVPKTAGHVIDIQKWLKEQNIKHKPTEKRPNGWVFSLENKEEAMALKLRWH